MLMTSAAIDIDFEMITRIHKMWEKNVSRLPFGQYVCKLLKLDDPTIFYATDENDVWTLLLENGHINDE